MNKIMLTARLMGAFALACLFISPAGAAMAFQSSVSFAYSLPPGIPLFVELPQYAGPDTITSVQLSLSGIAGGANYYPYFLDEGITVPSGPASWNVDLQGPDYALIAIAPIHTEFVGGTIPPCDDPDCAGEGGDAVFGPISTSFLLSGDALDLADFAGSGTVELLVFDSSEYDTNTLSGVLTESITTSAAAPTPEPSTWCLMMVGLGSLGATLRRIRRSAA